jgi:hypothetical protein
MLAAKGSEIGERQPGQGLRRGIGRQQMQHDKIIQIPEGLQYLRVDPQENAPQTVRLTSDELGQMPQMTHFGLEPREQFTVWPPGRKTHPIRAQEIRNQLRILGIRIGTAVPKPAATTLDNGGRNNIHSIVTRPEKIDQDIVGRFQTNLTVGRRDPKLVDFLREAGKFRRSFGHPKLRQQCALRGYHRHIIMGLAPINPYQQFVHD